MMENKDTVRNPVTDLRVLKVLFGDDNAAEPVPVRRPGVWVIDDEARVDWAEISTVSHTGRTKIGLNLGVVGKVSICPVQPC
jgi:hypothetical protein